MRRSPAHQGDEASPFARTLTQYLRAARRKEHGYRIYLTADHGNVEAEGMGRLSQGVVSELRGERVRTYRSDTLAASVPEDIDAFRFDLAGLPPDFLPLYAGTRRAFVPKGDQIVAHGGVSVEELIVPFVKVSVESADQ